MLHISRITKTSAASLKRKSEDILRVFTKTRQELADLNAENNAYLQEVDSKIAELNQEQELVSKDLKQNQKIIDNIDALLI